jgi:hypothetical protein
LGLEEAGLGEDLLVFGFVEGEHVAFVEVFDGGLLGGFGSGSDEVVGGVELRALFRYQGEEFVTIGGLGDDEVLIIGPLHDLM